jgi:hypothetical protein
MMAVLNSTVTVPGELHVLFSKVNQVPPDVVAEVAVHWVVAPLSVRTWVLGKVLLPTVYVKASDAGFTPMALTVKVTGMRGLLAVPPATLILPV